MNLNLMGYKEVSAIGNFETGSWNEKFWSMQLSSKRKSKKSNRINFR